MQNEPNFEKTSSRNEEFIKALIDKIVAHGTDLKAIDELIRKLPDPSAALEAMDKRVGELADRVEKLETNIGKTAGELEKVSRQLTLPADSIGQLSHQLENHAQLFEKPLKKSVHYTHFIGRSLLVCTLLGLMILGLLLLWNRTQIKADQHTENDIKWRHAKLSADSGVLRSLFETENAYRIDPEGFRAAVIEEEERRQQLYEKWLQLKQAEGDIQKLEEKKKKR